MFQYAIFLVGMLRAAPLAVLLPVVDSHWLAKIGHLLNG